MKTKADMKNANTNANKYSVKNYQRKQKKIKTNKNNIKSTFPPLFLCETFYVRTKFQWMLQEL